MQSRRWRETLGPPLLATLVTAALVAPTVAGPARRPVPTVMNAPIAPDALPSCRGEADAGPRGRPAAGTGGWYRLDPVVDASGVLRGQRLVLGRIGARGTTTLQLHVESFASGPSAGRVIVGEDDGRRSTVRIVDLGRRCARVAFEGSTLVRRAVLDPLGGGLVEFRLDRRTRADLGVWLRPLDASAPVRLLEPLPPIDRVGRVFSTELSWSLDGNRLVVTSCGEAVCVARILDRETRDVELVDDRRVGEVLGVVGDTLVAYAGCPSLPCDIVARDLRSGRTRTIGAVAGLAALAEAGGHAVVAFEDYGGDGSVRVVRLDGHRLRTIRIDGPRLVPAPHRAGASVELPPGVVAFAPGGRPSNGAEPASFVNLADGRRLTVEEVVR
jgi:hypothetical protein